MADIQERTREVLPPGTDVALHVVESGAGEPPLLLLHGFTGSVLDWTDVWPALAGGRRVVAYDQRGHGRSTNTGRAGDYTIDRLVADLAAVVDAVAPEPFHLLGHSLGGIVVQRYAFAHPDRLRSVVLMDSLCEPADALRRGYFDSLVAIAREQGLGALLPVMEPYIANRAVLPRIAEKLGQMDVEAYAALAAQLGTFEPTVDGLTRLDLPVTVLVGADDVGLVEQSERMAELLPQGRLAVIPAAGHSPQEDQPAAWSAAIEEHLRRAG